MPYHFKGSDADFSNAVREQRTAEAVLREHRTGEARAVELLDRVERERAQKAAQCQHVRDVAGLWEI